MGEEGGQAGRFVSIFSLTNMDILINVCGKYVIIYRTESRVVRIMRDIILLFTENMFAEWRFARRGRGI